MTSYAVSSGQTSSGITLSAGDTELVLSGGLTIATIVESGGTLTVDSGGVASATLINFGGTETVSAGGVDVGATLIGSLSGGLAVLNIDGMANGTVVIGDSSEFVFSGGVASGTVVSSGGSELVLSGGVAGGTVVSGGGNQTVLGTAIDAIVISGGQETVSAGGLAGGTDIAGGGSATVLSGGVASGALIAGGSLDLTVGATANGTIAFAGGVGGTLEIDGTTMPSAAILGFALGDTIDLRGLAWSSTNLVGFTSNTLTVAGGGVTDSLTLSGTAPGTTFSVTSDGSGGTAVTAAAAPSTQWTNSAGGNWLVAGNWSAGAPTAGVDATLGVLSYSYYTVTLAGNATANSLTIGNYYPTLALSTTSGSTPASLAIQGSLSNGGSFYIDAFSGGLGGSTLTIGGTLTNTDYLVIGNTILAATTTVTAAGLANTGTISLLGSSGTNRAVLDIISGTAPASNGGTLDLGLGVTVQIQGDFNNSGYLQIITNTSGASILTVGGTLTNTGTIYIENQNTSGTPTATAAGLANTGTIYVYGGSGTNTAQATLSISAAAPSTWTGYLLLSGHALVEFASGSITGIGHYSELVMNGGNAFVADAGSLGSNSALSGLASNAGTLDLEAGAVIQTQGDFSNLGTLDVDLTVYGAGSDLAIGGTLSNAGILSIGPSYYQAISGTSTVSAAGLANAGTIYLYGGTGTSAYQATLDITSGTAPSTLTGTLELSGHALAEFASGSITSIAGGSVLLVNGSSALVADAGSLASNSALSGLASNAGTMDLEGGAAVQTQGNFSNFNALYIDKNYYTAGSDLAIGGTLSNASTLYIGANLTSSGTSTVSAAALVNTGAIYLAGGTGTSTYQVTLDVTSAAAPSALVGIIDLSGHALVEFVSGSITRIARNSQLLVNGGNAFVADAGSLASNSALSGLASNAGTLDVESGTAIQTVGDFSNFGALYVDNSYYASGSDLAIGGTLSNANLLYIGANQATSGSSTVSAAGLANTGTIYLNGGTGTSTFQAALDIAGSATDNSLISLYGNALLSAGALTIANGGTVTLTSGGTAIGVSIGAGGHETVNSGGTSVAPTIAGGVLELAGGTVSGGAIVFAGGGTLQIDGTAMPTSPIDGFAAGDAIDLRVMTFDSTTTATYASATSTLAVSGGGVTDTLTLSGIPAGTGFTVASDGNGGTIVTETPAAGGTQWTNSAGGDWTISGDWSAGVPTSATGATIGAAGGYTVSLTAIGAANTLIIDHAGAFLSIFTNSGSAAPASLAVQGNLTNSGGIYVDINGVGGSTLTVGGTLTTTDYVQLGNSTTVTAPNVSVGALANSGQILLEGGLSAGPTLTATGDFSNTYYVFVDIYSGEGNSRVNVGGTLINTGTFEIGSTTLSAATTVTAAYLANTGTIYVTGGTGTDTNQATLDITSGTAPAVLVGSLNLSGRALVAFAGGSISSIANTSRLILNGASALVADASNTRGNTALVGLAGNAGYVELNSGAAIQTSGDLSNDGTFYVDYLYYNTAGGSSLSVGGTLSNAGGLYIGQYAVQSGSASTVTATDLTNTGTITLTGGTGTSTTQATLDITAAAAPSVLIGTFNLSGHALLEFTSGSISSIANTAHVTLIGASALVADATNTGSNSALTGLANNAGYLELDSGAAIQTSGGILNDGTLYVDYLYYNTSGGSSLSVGGTLSNAGYIYIGPYAVQSGSASTVTAAGLTNTGTIYLTGGTGTTTYQTTLDITASAAPAVLTGTFNLSGQALLEFTSGSITSIATGAGLTLTGATAVVADVTNTSSNSALSGLARNAGSLSLNSGAAIQTTGDLVNDGSLFVDYLYYATSGGSSLSVGGTLTNTGYIYIGEYAYQTGAASTVTATNLANTGTVYLTGGTGTSTYQATLDVTASVAPSVLTGTFDLSGNALLEFAGSASINSIAAGGKLFLNGSNAFVANSSNTLSNSALTGLASNAGYLYVESGSTLQTQGNFSNSGTLQLYDYVAPAASNLVIGGTLSNTGYLYIENYYTSGTTTLRATGLVNTGTVYLTGGTGTYTNQATLDITAGAAPAVMSGTVDLVGHALLEFAAGSIASIASNARLYLSGAAALVADAGNLGSNSALGGLASNAGVLQMDSGAVLAIQGNFLNSNQIEVDYYTVGGSTLTVGGTLTNAGSIYVGYIGQSAATTISAGGFDNTGTVYLFGNIGTGTYQTTLDIAGFASDSGTLYVDGNTVVSASSLTVESGGILYLSAGGTAVGVTVGSGGLEYVYSGGVSTSATIAGGTLDLAGGTVTATTIDFTLRGGALQIDGTTMPSNTIAGFRESDIIDLRGVAFSSSGTGSIAAGNVLTVSGGGSTYALQLDPLHNYTSASVVLTSDGSGGTDVAIISPPIYVSSGQTLTISTGVTDDNVNVLSGGTLIVLSAGTATDTIDSGGEILSGGVDLNGIVGGGGTMVVSAGGVASDTTVSALGQMTVASGGVAVDPTIAGGLFDLAAGGIASGTIAFTGSAGTLEIDGTTMPTNTISGFAGDEKIDLRALAWSATNSVTFNSATNTLTVSGGGTTDTLTLSGVPAGTRFGVASDGLGGTTIGTFQNNGTLTGTYLYGVVLSNATAQNPTTVAATGYVTNQTGQTAAYNGDAVYGTNAVAWTFSNFGTIKSTRSASVGVDLTAGGSVANKLGGSITGASDGIYIGGTAGTVSNFGAIHGIGTTGNGVALAFGGTVTNGAIGSAGALIFAARFGVEIGYAGGTGTVANFGSIASTGDTGVWLEAGVITNGVGGATTGSISGSFDGVFVAAGAGTVANYGTISGATDDGVCLFEGGSVSNGASGLTGGVIQGYAWGVEVHNSAGAVGNFGTISSTETNGGSAISLGAGGSIANGASGVIAGSDGIDVTGGAGTITNFGTIIGTGSSGVGVNLTMSGSTLTDAGTIIGSGGYAVTFAGGGNRLIVDPGAVFTGSVYGGGGTNDVVELAAGTVGATGTIVAGTLHGFDNFTIDPSAVWLASGANLLKAGRTLSNAGTLEIGGSFVVSGNLVDTGTIDINAGATLALATGASGTGSIAFAGSGGTIEIDGTAMPATTIAISGFTPGQTIDLRGVSGGNAGSAVLGSGNLLTVFEGGGSFALQLDPAQSFGGFALVGDGLGGTAILAVAQQTVSAGQTLIVSAGETLNGVSVQSGGTLEVASGASVVGTQISSGGSEIVDSGGFDSGTLVFGGGAQTVLSGGSTQGTVLDGAAVQTVFGSAGGTTVSSGDTQIVESGGVASGTIVSSGGSEIVLSAGLTIDTVIAGGTLELSAGALASGSIDFVGSSGVLRIDSNTMPTTPISGFVLGDSIDLRGLPSSAGNTVTFNAVTGALSVVSGSTTDTLTLSGIPAGTLFGLSNDGQGDTLVQEVVRSTNLFDFVFTYNDGKDYYYGTVADDGLYGYFVGQQITTLPGITLAGHYDIYNEEGLPTSQAPGTVQVVDYSHNGPGVASSTPLAFPGSDGSNGLGSESDNVLGTDGLTHKFSGTLELSFPTADLYGFVFTYTDGAAFYTGTVAVTTGSTPVIPVSGGMLGSYSVFAEGVTTQAAGTVVIDRFTEGGTAYVPSGSSAGGLGSETGSLTVSGTNYSFSDQQEPVLPSGGGTVPVTSPPGTSAVITAEVTEIYSEVLGRSPSLTELQTDSTELANGTTLASIRGTLAQSTEAQNDLNGLYQLVFDRSATSGELLTDTGLITDGSSLQAMQLILAQSSEAQADLGTIYSQVLGRTIGGSELTADMVQIGSETATAVADPNGRSGVLGVRDVVAHSSEAQGDLTTLFEGILGPTAPTVAELAAMEAQLSKPGVSLTTLGTALTNSGAAAAGTTIAAGAGNATLTAAATPTLFDFSNVSFGNDTIAGFDPTRDTIELPHALAANLTALLHQDTTSTAGGALITLSSTQSILLSGVTSTSLDQTNFLLV